VPKQRYDSAHLTENIVINTRRILIVCLPPVQELDIAGPAGVFAKANGALRDRGIAYEIELVTNALPDDWFQRNQSWMNN